MVFVVVVVVVFAVGVVRDSDVGTDSSVCAMLWYTQTALFSVFNVNLVSLTL